MGSLTAARLRLPAVRESQPRSLHFDAPEGCRRGTYSSVHTQTQTNTQRGPTQTNKQTNKPPQRKYGAGSRRGGALLIRGATAPRPHPQRAASLISHAEGKLSVCTATERRWLCLQREPRRDVDPVDVDQLTSFSYRTAAGLACSAPCPASVGRAAPSARTIFILTRRRGVPTRHTHKWDADGLRPRHLLESTHTQTHTNTNKHTMRSDKVRCGLTPWRRPPHQRS